MKVLVLFLLPALLALTIYGFIPAGWHSWMLLYFLYAVFQLLAVAGLFLHDIGKGDFVEPEDLDQTARLPTGIDPEEDSEDLERTWNLPVVG
jgi:hypothetical protein